MGPNKMISYREKQIDSVRKINGFESESALNSVIDAFQEWIDKQQHIVVKRYDRNYLAMILFAAKGSLETAKKRLDRRCTYCSLMPEMYDLGGKNYATEFMEVMESVRHMPLPVPTKDFYRVFLEQVLDVEKFNLISVTKFIAVNFSEYMLFRDCTVGYVGVIDLRGVKLSALIPKLNPITLKKMSMIGMEGYGSRYKALHFLHDSKLIETLVTLLKQAVNPKIAERFHTHRELDTLHQYVDKECLPADYGGFLKPSNEIFEIVKEEMTRLDHIELVKKIQTYSTDESKRTSNEFNNEYLGTMGSFRSLTID